MLLYHDLATTDGTNGQVLTTNGSGTLSFAGASGKWTRRWYSVTTTSTSITNPDTFSASSSRGGKYTVTLSDSTSGECQTAEVHIIHDGTNSSISQFGTVLQGGKFSELATFSTDISSGSVRLRVKHQRILLKFHTKRFF